MKKITVTATTTYTVQPATGPNHNNRPLEVIDCEGDRLVYVESEEEAENAAVKFTHELICGPMEINSTMEDE